MHILAKKHHVSTTMPRIDEMGDVIIPNEDESPTINWAARSTIFFADSRM
jgi:hypothetical protein